MEKSQEEKSCPLCGTILPYEKWLKVIGVYEEQQKYKRNLELELKKAKDQEKKLKEEYKKIRQKEKEIKTQYNLKLKEELGKNKKNYDLQQSKLKEKFEREKKSILNQAKKEGIKIGSEKEKVRAEKFKSELEKIKREGIEAEIKLRQKHEKQQEKLKNKLEIQKQKELKQTKSEGIKTGIAKQKSATEKVSKMAEKRLRERDKAMERVKKLEEMIKKGTTPQIEGFDFERKLTEQLKSNFPDDDIKQTGKKGDIIHTIQEEGKKVGKILYECKKTEEWQEKFIEQIQRDKARVKAEYGLIVSWASKSNKLGFWVEKDIIVIHPYGVLDVVTLIRETLVQIYALKLSRSEIEIKGRTILEFMQSEEFRQSIQESIEKSREAYELMKKEVKTHINTWKKRFEIYKSIYRNTDIIKENVRYILLHGKIPEKLPAVKELPALTIPTINK